ncbi:MAG: hypothetical protein ACREEM_25135 [Blastocatellia bacterium]
MMPIRNLRWWIATLLAAATALNYLDRQSLPVVISVLQKSIPLTDQQYSQLQGMFLLAYGVMYAGGGGGLMGAVGCLGGMLFNLLIGMLLARGASYSIVFFISDLLHPASLFAILTLVRKIESVEAL